MSENMVILIGNSGDAPELQYLPDGTPVAKFNLATTTTWNDKASGEKKEHTEWHKIEIWGNYGETCAAAMERGKRYYVKGSLHTSRYEAAPDVRARNTVVRANKVKFLN